MYEQLLKDMHNCFGNDSTVCDCDSCSYNWLSNDGDYTMCVDTLSMDATTAIEQLLQRLRWIPVTEKTPDLMHSVLVTDGKNVGVGWMFENKITGDVHWATPLADVEGDDVTHWMELPDPPKGDGTVRYRLQRKERFVLPNVLGNHNFPVYTYRWKDVAVSDDKFALEDMMPNNRDYRIEDTVPPKEET